MSNRLRFFLLIVFTVAIATVAGIQMGVPLNMPLYGLPFSFWIIGVLSIFLLPGIKNQTKTATPAQEYDQIDNLALPADFGDDEGGFASGN